MRDRRQIAPHGPARPPSRLSRASWLVAMSLLTALSGLVAGCGHAPPAVGVTRRAYLSKRAMRFDADPLEMRFRQHMFGSREAADGGYGEPGGGCGCN